MLMLLLECWLNLPMLTAAVPPCDGGSIVTISCQLVPASDFEGLCSRYTTLLYTTRIRLYPYLPASHFEGLCNCVGSKARGVGACKPGWFL